jgi:ABC-2 type transport system permease protein
VILTLLRVALINLRRDRVMQASVFLLPVVFFSIFAGVFGQQSLDTTPPVRVGVVDEDRSAASARLIAALEQERGLLVRTSGAPAQPELLDRALATAMVRDGELPVALVIPAGYAADVRASEIELLADRSDRVAPQIVAGLLQKVALGASLEVLARPDAPLAAPDALPSAAFARPIPVRVVDVLGEKKANPVIAFYAGGIAVMFLLFNAAGAGGSLLDEVESGTLERLLTSNAGMTAVLAGKWIFIALLGMFQITVMFVWGMLVFGLDLLPHLPGFFVITAFTAAAASGFGLVLATLCKSRHQLGGISTLLILIQSALGGSLFPRFLMSEELQRIGLFTFNAWALDGYLKVFWRDAPIAALWPQLAVLSALTVVFLGLARWLARRWETI